MSIRNKVLIACYNWDKRVLGLPNDKYSLKGVSKLDFDLNAPSFNVRKDLISFDISLIIWKRMLDESGQRHMTTDVDKFHDWLRNTKAGQSVFAEAQKATDSRLSKEMSYDKVFAKSTEADSAKRLEFVQNVALMLAGLIVFGIAAALTLVILFKIFMA